MNSKWSFLFSFLAFILQSCVNSPTRLEKNTTREYHALSDENLFDGLAVSVAATMNKDSIDIANQLFLNALDLYRNKNKINVAIEGFKESIFKFPSSKAYYELGNAFLDQKDYDQALRSFKIAEQLGYEPFANLLFNMSCVYSLQDEVQLSANYLEYAIQAGYANFHNVEKDSDLSNLRKSHWYNIHYQRALNGVSDRDNIFWLQFKLRFPVAALPLKLDQVVHESVLADENYIGYDYEVFVSEMRNEKFSREVSRGFYYFAKIKETEQFTALIYIDKDMFLNEYSPLNYVLVTYSPTGKVLDKKSIAGHRYHNDDLKKTHIKKDGSIHITSYALTYENDPSVYGFYDNKVKDMKEISQAIFVISEQGKIIALEDSSLANLGNETD